jgi:hypothetical protein
MSADAMREENVCWRKKCIFLPKTLKVRKAKYINGCSPNQQLEAAEVIRKN